MDYDLRDRAGEIKEELKQEGKYEAISLEDFDKLTIKALTEEERILKKMRSYTRRNPVYFTD